MEHKGTKYMETERLILRPYTAEDAQAMYSNWASDQDVTRYLMWPAHSDTSVSESVLREWIANYSKMDYYHWAIVCKEVSDEPIGDIAVVSPIDEKIQSAHIGYCIGKAWWHKGITSEALRAVMDFLFDEVGVNRIESRHDPRNPYSGAVMQKCGLKYEGTLRQSDWNNQGICDASYYGLLSSERQLYGRRFQAVMKLRIKFKKIGPVRFIGHLDVMRYFQKAIRRAGIDVRYTTGFSPHQVMSFAAPLGVGLTSNGEYMDIEVNSMESCQDIKERLNQASVPGIEVISVKVLPEGAGNAMASVAAASYTVRFREGREPAADMGAALPGFLAKEQILITKETKKGSREVDLKPGIYWLEWSDGAFRMLVDASSGGNIKPIQIIEALLADCGELLQENALIVTREEVYTDTGTEERPELVPLEDVGTVQ